MSTNYFGQLWRYMYTELRRSLKRKGGFMEWSELLMGLASRYSDQRKFSSCARVRPVSYNTKQIFTWFIVNDWTWVVVKPVLICKYVIAFPALQQNIPQCRHLENLKTNSKLHPVTVWTVFQTGSSLQ